MTGEQQPQQLHEGNKPQGYAIFAVVILEFENENGFPWFFFLFKLRAFFIDSFNVGNEEI